MSPKIEQIKQIDQKERGGEQPVFRSVEGGVQTKKVEVKEQEYNPPTETENVNYNAQAFETYTDLEKETVQNTGQVSQYLNEMNSKSGEIYSLDIRQNSNN